MILDGPAEGVSFMLRRAPMMLRLVRASNGHWDALNEPGDEIRESEAPHCYIMVGRPSQFHMSCRPRSASGMFWSARYRHLAELEGGPDDTTMRSNDAWVAWCGANRERLMALYQASCESSAG